MTNPTLDAYQQIFGMACLVGRSSGYKGTAIELQLQLQYDLSFYLNNVPPVTVMGQTGPSVADSSVTPVLGSWNLVWGPALLEENNDGVADNAVFVAQCDAVAFPGGPVMPAYVVAIAATNPDSLYDWEAEDFSVSQVVNWSTYNPSDFSPSGYNGTNPYISLGTATGISNLLKLTTASSAAAPGTTLEQFLSSVQPAADTAVIFCGHSLAGALSPTLALYLTEQKTLKAFDLTLVYPTAGATPGEATFASLFNSTFPVLPSGWEPQSLPYQSWNTMHWNDLDVVPHAWQKQDLQQIANLYGHSPNFGTAATLSVLQSLALLDSSRSGAVYTRIQNSSLSGTLQHSDGGSAISVPPQSLKDYVEQLFIQHVEMYSGIPADSSNPEVTGLILPQPLPKPIYPKLVPGVSSVTKAELIERIVSQIIGWISSHALSALKPVLEA
ncbi:lipase family protein [Chryseobacterium gambrini]|uniref:lipase family protein n=1 Tax=Chryseobacterium gambrini TaxID=373672 RepID=UPI003D129B3F